VVDLGETGIENLIRLLNLCYALHPEMARFSAFEKKVKITVYFLFQKLLHPNNL